MSQLLRCDGCLREYDLEAIIIVKDYDHHVRYCRECASTYQSFVASCKTHEYVMQRELDEWIMRARVATGLLLCPMDLCPAPTYDAHPATEGLVLG